MTPHNTRARKALVLCSWEVADARPLAVAAKKARWSVHCWTDNKVPLQGAPLALYGCISDVAQVARALKLAGVTPPTDFLCFCRGGYRRGLDIGGLEQIRMGCKYREWVSSTTLNRISVTA